MKINTLSLPKRLMLVAGATASALALTATTAFASTFYGGETVSPNCHAYIISSGSSFNLAVGAVSGDANCQVRLWQRKAGSTAQVVTVWAYGQTTALYHNDGVHQLRVQLSDGTAGGVGYGPWIN